MAHTTRDKKRLLSRVRRIQGQISALEAALEAQAECAAVLQQIAAVRGGINGLMAEILEGHLREHVAAGTLASAAHKRDMDGVVRMLRTYLK